MCDGHVTWPTCQMDMVPSLHGNCGTLHGKTDQYRHGIYMVLHHVSGSVTDCTKVLGVRTCIVHGAGSPVIHLCFHSISQSSPAVVRELRWCKKKKKNQ